MTTASSQPPKAVVVVAPTELTPTFLCWVSAPDTAFMNPRQDHLPEKAAYTSQAKGSLYFAGNRQASGARDPGFPLGQEIQDSRTMPFT